MGQSNSFYIVICFMLCSNSKCISDLKIYIFDSNKSPVKILQHGKISKLWKGHEISFSRHPIAIEGKKVLFRRIFFLNTNPQKSLTIAIKTEFNKNVLNPNISFEKEIIPPLKDFVLNFQYNCRKNEIFNKNLIGWSSIFFNVSDLTNNKYYTFSFTKICTNKDFNKPDPSLLFLLLFSLIIVYIAVHQNNRFFLYNNKRKKQKIGKNKDLIELDISNSYVFFLVFALCSFILFFSIFAKKILLKFLSICFILSFYVLIYIFCLQAMQKYLQIERNSKKKYFIAYFGKIKKIELQAIFLSLFIAFYYLFTKNWILNNIIASCFVFFALKCVQLNSLKEGVYLLIFVFIYDIFWVYSCQFFFKKKIMEDLLLQINLPLKMEFPSLLERPGNNNFLILGLGDLTVPGLLIAYFKDFVKKYNKQEKKWVVQAFIAYGFGLSLTGSFFVINQSSQPAMLYIVPSLFLFFVYLLLTEENFECIWHG